MWSGKTKTTGTVEERQARYRFIYELVGGDWRIAQSVDELVVPADTELGLVVPPPSTRTAAVAVPAVAVPAVVVPVVAVPAVAGYLKRQTASSRRTKPASAALKPGDQQTDAPPSKSDTWLPNADLSGR